MGFCKKNAAALQKKIKKDPADIKSLLALTALYMQEARNTGNLSIIIRPP